MMTLKKNTASKYQKFLTKLKLIAIGLDSISAQVDRAVYAHAHSEHRDKIVREIESDYTVENFGKDHFNVVAEFNLSLSLGTEDGGVSLLTIQAKISGHFHAAHPVSKDAADQFARAEARLLFWPYFRQYVSDMTGRMHVLPITIPLTIEAE